MARDRNFPQLSTFFRALAFLVAVCCLTWVAVLWWWQRTGHSAQVQDLVLYLGVLPIAVALALLGLRWVWRRAAARQAAVAGAALASAPGPAAAVDAGAAGGVEAQARHATLQLVMFGARSVAGEQAGDLLEAAAAGKPLPAPDAELTNDDGLPVLCARMRDQLLDLDVVRSEMEPLFPLVQQRLPDAQATETPEHVLRALAALKPAMETPRDFLWSQHQAALMALEDGGASMARLPPAQRPPLPALRVLLGWPAHWSPWDQALARTWVEHCLQGEACDLTKGYAVSYAAVSGAGEELWLRADQMGHGATRTPWLLVAGCDSDVDPVRVDALAGAQRLYDASARPGGCIPGEAAAALLLAPAGWAPPADADMPTVRLHRPALLRRDKSVEAAGRVGHRELGEACAQSLEAAQIPAADLGMVVCDADQHSPRSTELYGMAVDALQHLDPVEDMRLLGKVTGHTGTASALLVLAAAAEAVKSLKKPVLALCVGDSHLRMALVLKPSEAADGAAS